MSVDIASILVPTDFSPCCTRAAIPHARHLAERLRVPLDILYVSEDKEDEHTTEEVLEHRLRTYVESHGLGGMVRNTLVRFGAPVEQILNVVEECGSCLIVMATHGRTGLSHVFLGSVTEKVLRQAPCPVYVVRGAEPTSE